MNKIFRKFMLLILVMLLMLSDFANAKDAQMKNAIEQQDKKIDKAVFAGGCFWCMEADFEKVKGVKEVISGYMGGNIKNPTYDDYAEKGYKEAVAITFDTTKISYKELLDFFWQHIDPTDSGGQFCDRGHGYTSAVFYHTDEQKRLADESKKELEESGKLGAPIATNIINAGMFYAAEDYHQDYYKKKPLEYKLYRLGCGRDRQLKNRCLNIANNAGDTAHESKYKKLNQQKLKKKLSGMQFKVTQENGTEPPFENEYWDNKKEGIYVDIISGEPLFSSRDQFKSGTGWPSFTQPLEPDNVVEKQSRSGFDFRMEIRSKHADSHLGHVFNDGPKYTGLRYCINSAALRFIPKDELKQQGYEDYLKLFE
ncbi:MAG: peptide-methionine (R)-S-oxide reductase MsrB [Candidatus Omnitrophica bacterium]|nr:peptide-methionine (R)-S-oxide reductase MsrB [Candidatus Omnitrophota bacterium]